MDATKAEIIRYLGGKGQALSPDMDALITACLAECKAAAAPLFVWRAFTVCRQETSILLDKTLELKGGDIFRHLQNARQAVLLALTLGAGVDALIRRWEYRDMTRAVVLDACASQLVEELGEAAEREIQDYAAPLGLHGNFRYSPGYGDFGLDIQPALLAALDAHRRIGLTCTESLILLPRKSVTAVVGLLPEKETAEVRRGCEYCSMREQCNMKGVLRHNGVEDDTGTGNSAV